MTSAPGTPAPAAETPQPDLGPLQWNALDLEAELGWFERVTRFRLHELLAQTSANGDGDGNAEDGAIDLTPPDLTPSDLAPPDIAASPSPYAAFLRHYEPGFVERLALILGLVPHLRPRLLDLFAHPDSRAGSRHSLFGGTSAVEGFAFWPTGETLAFLIAGDDLACRFQLHQLFDSRHFLVGHGILLAESRADGALRGSPLCTPLRLSDEYLSLFTRGETRYPAFGADFPARRLETGMDWGDLVLHPHTLEQVEEIRDWLQHGQTLLGEWGLGAKQRPGYRSLFYGPPGTGKTLTARLLGRVTGRAVFSVDLSMVVSKYIGETEKNLARVFDQAEHKGWILFFDEADALFGQRTETRDSRDRHANQEVAFLLQRIETFDGVVILASNLRGNLDEAFARRFESIIHFPAPKPRERLRLWRSALPAGARLAGTVDLDQIAHAHALTGGGIANVVRYAALRALAGGTDVITTDMLLQGIRREFNKEGIVA